MATNSQRAVFFGKDGTLIPNIPGNGDPDRVFLSPGAGEALRRLSRAGFSLFVASNQPGVARGLFPESSLASVTARIERLLRVEGVALSGVYYCVHHPYAAVEAYRVACACRKPAAGLLERAAADHRLDLAHSWMVGDILDDVAAGKAAGARTVLFDSGRETEWRLSPARLPEFVASGLVDCADQIVAASGPGLRTLAA